METKREFGFRDDTLARILPQGLEIHIVSIETAVEAIFEINRISAIAFGLYKDGDKFDKTYKYLCVYDVKNKEIVSFYRYILCSNAITEVDGNYKADLATGKFYKFSNTFVSNTLYYSMEFGRSVVNKDSVYEKQTGLGLSAIWSGLGVLLYEYNLKYIQKGEDPKIKYFFGKFSLQINSYCIDSRNLIFSLFSSHFGPFVSAIEYLEPKEEYVIETLDYKHVSIEENFDKAKIELNIILAKRGEPKPKLAYTYASLGGLTSYLPILNMKLNSYEMLILNNVSMIKKSYIRRFVGDYKTINPSLFLSN